jgi:hypothetical protein
MVFGTKSLIEKASEDTKKANSVSLKRFLLHHSFYSMREYYQHKWLWWFNVGALGKVV